MAPFKHLKAFPTQKAARDLAKRLENHGWYATIVEYDPKSKMWIVKVRRLKQNL